MVSFNSGETDTLDYGGGNWPAPGMYHAQLMDASEHDGYALLKFGVLAGTVADQVGREVSHRFFLPEEGDDEKKKSNKIKRLLRAAVALGMITESQIQKGANFSLDYASAIGATCVIKVSQREYEKDGEKRKATEIGDFGFGIWPCSAKDVAAVPKDQRWVNATAQPASAQPVAAGAGVGAGAAADADEFGDV